MSEDDQFHQEAICDVFGMHVGSVGASPDDLVSQRQMWIDARILKTMHVATDRYKNIGLILSYLQAGHKMPKLSLMKAASDSFTNTIRNNAADLYRAVKTTDATSKALLDLCIQRMQGGRFTAKDMLIAASAAVVTRCMNGDLERYLLGAVFNALNRLCPAMMAEHKDTKFFGLLPGEALERATIDPPDLEPEAEHFQLSDYFHRATFSPQRPPKPVLTPGGGEGPGWHS